MTKLKSCGYLKADCCDTCRFLNYWIDEVEEAQWKCTKHNMGYENGKGIWLDHICNEWEADKK